MSELWSKFIEGGSSFTFVPEANLNVVNAAIDVCVRKKGDSSVVSISYKDSTAVICTLSHGSIPQAGLNLTLLGGSEYTIAVNGEKQYARYRHISDSFVFNFDAWTVSVPTKGGNPLVSDTRRSGDSCPRRERAAHQSRPLVKHRYMWVASGASSNGQYAQEGDQVEILYKARVGDHKAEPFEQTPKGESLFALDLRHWRTNWLSQGVTGMQVGEMRRIFIPPSLGYGKKVKNSPVKPNSHLVYGMLFHRSNESR
ncbi:LOW QUALITY PROTEIN: hypothetical protein CVT26_008796 [Gymnopilus dilepis]|uniref:peptidylprolyl isomerase n=1 Tax=Gymnopilus dilepis TaxID=231916 RepID=A0A409WUG1_9AGAR|nr:LOW QUALITY PROTEIN: hypothetical protein CVT26_008796 [Gymnopilus dilepis]